VNCLRLNERRFDAGAWRYSSTCHVDCNAVANRLIVLSLTSTNNWPKPICAEATPTGRWQLLLLSMRMRRQGDWTAEHVCSAQSSSLKREMCHSLRHWRRHCCRCLSFRWCNTSGDSFHLRVLTVGMAAVKQRCSICRRRLHCNGVDSETHSPLPTPLRDNVPFRD